jgi:NADH-quinone oxidoreductase subunit A
MIGFRAETIPCSPAWDFFPSDFVKHFTIRLDSFQLDVVLLPMGQEFTPIFLFLAVAVMTAIGMLSASALLGPRKATRVKEMPYESGMDPIGDARQRFDVRYYLVAIVFLLFDVELLFLYPWAVAQYSRTANPPHHEAAQVAVATAVAGIPVEFRNLVFFEILVFVVVLTAAFAYAWRKGVFEWR